MGTTERSGQRGPTTPGEITEAVLRSFGATPAPRLAELMRALVSHLHAFAVETALTEAEWEAGIDFLTAAGQRCTPTRQELILLSDTLGLSMVVDTVNHGAGPTVTESTVLGPFYVAGSPQRPMGASIAEDDDCGEPALVHGMVTGPDGTPVPDAVLDVWQNAANGRYAVQDDTQDPDNLRGRFTTGADGRFRFWSVRPTDYPLPTDGPVGEMIRATGRHPWRAAHLHLRVSAPGHRPVTTHLFDDGSRYLDSDTVFGVKPSLVCHYEHHGPDDPPGPDAPAGASAGWYSLERTVVLAPERD